MVASPRDACIGAKSCVVSLLVAMGPFPKQRPSQADDGILYVCVARQPERPIEGSIPFRATLPELSVAGMQW